MARSKRAQFGWRDPRIGGNADAVGQHLKVLEKRYGVLQPETLVEEARAVDSPLHRYFEWDDTVAAESYRQEQARGLLRAVVMASPSRPGETVRAFLLVEGADSNGYVSTVRALSDPEMSAQILARAKGELRVFRLKYGHLKELASVLQAIEEVA